MSAPAPQTQHRYNTRSRGPARALTPPSPVPAEVPASTGNSPSSEPPQHSATPPSRSPSRPSSSSSSDSPNPSSRPSSSSFSDQDSEISNSIAGISSWPTFEELGLFAKLYLQRAMHPYACTYNAPAGPIVWLTVLSITSFWFVAALCSPSRDCPTEMIPLVVVEAIRLDPIGCAVTLSYYALRILRLCDILHGIQVVVKQAWCRWRKWSDFYTGAMELLVLPAFFIIIPLFTTTTTCKPVKFTYVYEGLRDLVALHFLTWGFDAYQEWATVVGARRLPGSSFACWMIWIWIFYGLFLAKAEVVGQHILASSILNPVPTTFTITHAPTTTAPISAEILGTGLSPYVVDNMIGSDSRVYSTAKSWSVATLVTAWRQGISQNSI